MMTEKVGTGIKLKVHSLIDKVYHPIYGLVNLIQLIPGLERRPAL